RLCVAMLSTHAHPKRWAWHRLNLLVLVALTGLLGCQDQVARPSKRVEAEPRVELAVSPNSRENRDEAADSGVVDAEDEEIGRTATPVVSAESGNNRQVVWDFGVVPPGKEIRHHFTIRNDGTRVWTIKRVSKSCACTYGEFTTKDIKP